MFRVTLLSGRRLSSMRQELSKFHDRNFFSCTSIPCVSHVDSKNAKNQVQGSNFKLSSRQIYTITCLQIDRLKRVQGDKQEMFGADKARFIERIRGYLEDEEKSNSILGEDIINYIAFAEDESDLNIIEKLIDACYSSGNVVEGISRYGPLLMKLYYMMNQVERAYKNIRDTERFQGFFNSASCYKIVMTLLYNAGRYEDVIECYKLAEKTAPEDERPRMLGTITTITLAAAAKVNTPEVYQEMRDLFLRSIHLHDHNIRARGFLSYLAYNHGDPATAINLITHKGFHILLKDIMFMSYVKLERYEDILMKLRMEVKNVRRDSNIMMASAYNAISNALHNIEDHKLRDDIERELRDISQSRHVSPQKFDELLFRPITHDGHIYGPYDTNQQDQPEQQPDSRPYEESSGRQRNDNFDQRGRRFTYQNQEFSSRRTTMPRGRDNDKFNGGSRMARV